MSHANDELYAATLPRGKCTICGVHIEPGIHRVYVTQTCCDERDVFCRWCWADILSLAAWGTLHGVARAN